MFEQTQKHTHSGAMRFDALLLLVPLALLLFGFIMVASASMPISNHQFQTPFYFLIHQAIYIVLGIIVAWAAFYIPMRTWQSLSGLLVLGSLFLLVVVLVPGLGRNVNGSVRWIGLGPITLQASELMKLMIILYAGDFLVRRQAQLRQGMQGYLGLWALVGISAFLLLLEPDFGSTTVIVGIVTALVFLSGMQLRYFLYTGLSGVFALMMLAISQPYRLKRLTGFLNPWLDPFSSGYQLTQSLIAFGRGGWYGLGLGEGVQKLFYLPEAHTDFLFSVLVEEMGLVGGGSVLCLFVLLVWRLFYWGRMAGRLGMLYHQYVAYGMGVWLSLQALINIGVSAGLLPTKGLTLPLMSYGGSSMIISCLTISIALRISQEVMHAMQDGRRRSG